MIILSHNDTKMDLSILNLPNPCKLFIVGDLHVESVAFRRAEFESTLELIASDPVHNRVIFTGDIFNGIVPRDRRHAVHEVSPEFPTLEEARRYIRRVLKPVAKQALVFLTGNHEETISNMQGDISETIAEILEIPYGGKTCILEVTQNGHERKILATHGSGSIESRVEDLYRRQNNLESALRKKLIPIAEADIYVCGHYHKFIKSTPIEDLKMGTENGHMKAYYQWYGKTCVATPSFLSGYAPDVLTYSESNLFRPNELGCALITLENGNTQNIQKVVYI